jgi:hypothetical protein
MKRTNLLKKYAILFLFIFMLGTPLCHMTFTTTVHASEIQPLSDDIRWIYQNRNGVYYRRLFNYTTNSWIGNWERVG